MVTSVPKLLLAALILATGAVAMAQQRARPHIAATLGENAYKLQQRTRFSMGYPTRQNDGSTSGGSEQHVNANLSLGPLSVSCDDAYLYLAQDVDIFNSGRLFCPTDNGPRDLTALRDQIDSSLKWDERTDHTQNQRRANVYGNSVAAAYEYLSSAPMRGTVLAVPLYSWLDDSGLYLELNAVRHAKQNSVPSYELSFSWYPSCMSSLIAERLQSGTTPANDAERADQMQKRAAELCDQLPQPHTVTQPAR